MRSTLPPFPAPETTGAIDDRTTAARIRDAAIHCFAESGVSATSVRTIASAAGVSPALVMHHFGTKDRLRQACDHHVAALIRSRKEAAVAEGPDLDPLGQLQAFDTDVPLLKYLGTTLADGTPDVSALLDELVEDAIGYTQRAIDNGLMAPSDDLRARTTVLMLWSLGALVLHEHVERLLGVDLTGDPAATRRYTVPAAEILGTRVFAEGIYERIRDSFADIDHPGGTP